MIHDEEQRNNESAADNGDEKYVLKNPRMTVMLTIGERDDINVAWLKSECWVNPTSKIIAKARAEISRGGSQKKAVKKVLKAESCSGRKKGKDC